MTALFAKLIEASWQASIIAVIVLGMHWLFGSQLMPRWRCGLWTIVFARLVLPSLPPRPITLANAPDVPPIAAPAETVVAYGVIVSTAPDLAAQTMPTTASERSADWTAIAASTWLLVAGVLVGVRLAAAYRFHRRVRRSPPMRDTRVLEVLAQTASRVGVSVPMCVETDLVQTPALAGVFAPRLLLPRGLTDRLSVEEIEIVILHELAHLRRRDVLIGWITWLIATIHWFNPMVWLAAARFRAERELACDAAVLAHADGSARTAYGRTILRVLELFPTPPPRATLAVGMLSSRRTIQRRIAAIATPPTRWPIVGPLVFIALGCGALTGPATRPAPVATKAVSTSQPADVVTNTYDVRDVIIHVPNFTNAPDLGVVGATTKPTNETAPPTPAQLVEDLMQHIRDEVDPSSWRARGGAVGEMVELNGFLLVTQTPANHEAIQLLLQDLRGARGVQVTVEVRFITGDEAFRTVEKLSAGKRWQAARDHQFWPAYLSEDEARLILTAVQASRETTIVTAPRITLFNGQRAYVLVSRQSAYVKDLKPSTTQPGKYDTDIGIAQSGVLLDAEANVSADRKIVSLNLRPQLSTLLAFEPVRWPGAPAGRDNLLVQIPHMSTTKVHTTTAIPDGQTALLRLRPRLDPPSSTQPAGPPLLMMVRPRIIISEPGEPPQPMLNARLPAATTRRAK